MKVGSRTLWHSNAREQCLQISADLFFSPQTKHFPHQSPDHAIVGTARLGLVLNRSGQAGFCLNRRNVSLHRVAAICRLLELITDALLGELQEGRQILCCTTPRCFGHFSNCSNCNDATTFLSSAGPNIDYPVARSGYTHVTLHQDHCIAQLNQPIELRDEPLYIRRMQPRVGSSRI